MIFQSPKLKDMAKRAGMDKVSNNGDLVDTKHEPRSNGGPALPKSSQVFQILHTDAQHIRDMLPVTDFQSPYANTPRQTLAQADNSPKARAKRHTHPACIHMATLLQMVV
ncbi:hypothetical protein J3459_013695 [Metarhizium acridum]|nr:hypothetical protein J3459_013695 [Metarhizium acridum]